MAKLSDRQQQLLKEGKHFGVVATVGEDGRPQTSVVWVDTDGENVVFNTTQQARQGPQPRARTRVVSISVWDNDDPYAYFEVEGAGRADEEGAEGAHQRALAALRGQDFHTPVDRVIARVRPQRVLDHGVSS